MTNGIKTSYWGPHAWAFLFSSIAGAYPVTLDETNRDHVKIAKAFKTMLTNLQHLLPCRHCRESYRTYAKEVPISEYMGSRRMMMKWLYVIHDRVNKKLMQQEQELFQLKKKELEARSLTPAKLKVECVKLRSVIFKTKASPPFEKVLAMYEKHRA